MGNYNSICLKLKNFSGCKSQQFTSDEKFTEPKDIIFIGTYKEKVNNNIVIRVCLKIKSCFL